MAAGLRGALPSEPASDTEQQQHRRRHERGGVGGEAPLLEADSATSSQDRLLDGGGGVVATEASPSPELERQINDLEDSIARQREQVKTLASLQHRTGDAESQLQAMEQQLEVLQQSLARVGEEGARDE